MPSNKAFRVATKDFEIFHVATKDLENFQNTQDTTSNPYTVTVGLYQNSKGAPKNFQLSKQKKRNFFRTKKLKNFRAHLSAKSNLP